MAVHVDDLEDMTQGLDAVTLIGNTTERAHDETGDGCEAAGTLARKTTDDTRRFAEIIQGHDRVDGSA